MGKLWDLLVVSDKNGERISLWPCVCCHGSQLGMDDTQICLTSWMRFQTPLWALLRHSKCAVTFTNATNARVAAALVGIIVEFGVWTRASSCNSLPPPAHSSAASSVTLRSLKRRNPFFPTAATVEGYCLCAGADEILRVSGELFKRQDYESSFLARCWWVWIDMSPPPPRCPHHHSLSFPSLKPQALWTEFQTHGHRTGQAGQPDAVCPRLWETPWNMAHEKAS